MDSLRKDRMILKRLVESYGKKDVLNYVKHLNESVTACKYNGAELLKMYQNEDDNIQVELENVLNPIIRDLETALKSRGMGVYLECDYDANDSYSAIGNGDYFYVGAMDNSYNYQYSENENFSALPGFAVGPQGKLYGYISVTDNDMGDSRACLVEYNSASDFVQRFMRMFKAKDMEVENYFNVVEEY